MSRENQIHIMLDLETASLDSRPVIIEIGAVQFDLDTGEEMSRFQCVVDFKSSTRVGLKASQETINWLKENIPSTLEASMDSRTGIPIWHALLKFNQWVESLQGYNRYTCKVWGNGAAADNKWISSAYEACRTYGHLRARNLKPWEFYGDSCVRTIVQECLRVTGKDFANLVPFEGTKHKAMDDCKHQIKYLVAARNEIWGRGPGE